MKVGNLVSWYCPISDDHDAMDGKVYYEEDTGIVTNVKPAQFFVLWQSGEGSGWYFDGHASISVIHESR